MRGFAIAASLVAALSAAPAFAQPAQPPAQPKPAPQVPAQQPPAQPPAPAAATPAPQPPAPFPAGAKIAWINPQRVFQESNDGKAGLTRVQALISKKQTEGADKQKQLQANQTKLQTSGSVMNDTARGQLEKEIERQQTDAQRFQQDAQAEINELQQEVQNEFVKKVTPLIEQVAKEKGLQMVFDVTSAGIAWGDPGLDLTAEVIKKLDGPKPPATPKP
jgi:outer membrane protein